MDGKMSGFEKFTATVICILEYFTEFVVAYQIYRLSGGSFLLAIGALFGLTIVYSTSAVLLDGSDSLLDMDKAKDNVAFLQPYWLLINTALAVALSNI